ncbi:MAG: diaminopropionate ammonia-lyase [Betaproteobacteria bacterium]|nr:diaminopropionate ammonia-lyase [Betaproteobacteria bacterium]
MAALSPDGIRTFCNPGAAAGTEPYPPAHAAILNDAGFSAAFDEIRGWPGYAATPLQRLPGLAASLGIAELHYKDEGGRFGLKSFKALGGAYAVFRLLANAVQAANAGQAVTSRELIAGAHKGIVKDLKVTCATDGNHGRSVAWGAQLFGCRCVVFVHEHVSAARRAAIAHYGAEVIEVPGNYDDSVRHAATEAGRHGWTVVSDTTYEGYREIPVDVMHGYGVIAREVIGQMAGQPPTHVFVQAGVGGLAAAVCAAFWIGWGERRPQLVVVEPDAADCYFKSAQAGVPVAVTGNLDTVMAGLACGEVSPLAWEILREGANAFAAIDDRYALDAMRALARPAPGDPAIVAGETGGCGLALLLALQAHPEHRAALALTAASRVLLIGSEGDTDPALYRQIVGVAASSSTT